MKKVFYPNLKAEMSRRGLTYESLAVALAANGCKISVTTVCQKINGNYPFTLAEAKAIKSVLNVDIPLEELFDEVG